MSHRRPRPTQPYSVDTETLHTEAAGEASFLAKVSTAYRGVVPLVSVLYSLYPHRNELAFSGVKLHDDEASLGEEGLRLFSHVVGRHPGQRILLKRDVMADAELVQVAALWVQQRGQVSARAPAEAPGFPNK